MNTKHPIPDDLDPAIRVGRRSAEVGRQSFLLDLQEGTPAVAKEGVTSFPGAGGQGLRNERAGADQRMAK
jgi:hypothetical protein